MTIPDFLFVDFDDNGGSILRSHISVLVPRMIRAGLRVKECRYRVVAAGIDNKDRIISIATNRPRLKNRGMHAEERVMYASPRSLSRVLILRVGARGNLLPIHPCRWCSKLAKQRGVAIETVPITAEDI